MSSYLKIDTDFRATWVVLAKQEENIRTTIGNQSLIEYSIFFYFFIIVKGRNQKNLLYIFVS